LPIIREADAPVEASGDDAAAGGYRCVFLSEAGGLTQFGANLETLAPGARSSICHWHEAEDEFVYMLSGEVTLHEGGTARPLLPGEAACFRAGTAAGHYLENTGGGDARYLIVGTRAARDRVTYPDHDRVLTVDRDAGTSDWTTIAGAPAGNPYRGG
jgi:uncharacterized cupin superfamily protein